MRTDRIAWMIPRGARRISRRSLHLSVYAFHLCVAVVIVFTIVSPGIRELRLRRSTEMATQEELRGARERRKVIGAMRSQLLKLQREMNKRDPMNTDTQGVHSLVRDIARTSEMTLKTFTSMEADGEYLCVLEGGFDNAVTFLSDSIDATEAIRVQRFILRAIPPAIGTVELELLLEALNVPSQAKSSCAESEQ